MLGDESKHVLDRCKFLFLARQTRQDQLCCITKPRSLLGVGTEPNLTEPNRTKFNRIEPNMHHIYIHMFLYLPLLIQHVIKNTLTLSRGHSHSWVSPSLVATLTLSLTFSNLKTQVVWNPNSLIPFLSALTVTNSSLSISHRRPYHSHRTTTSPSTTTAHHPPRIRVVQFHAVVQSITGSLLPHCASCFVVSVFFFFLHLHVKLLWRMSEVFGSFFNFSPFWVQSCFS